MKTLLVLLSSAVLLSACGAIEDSLDEATEPFESLTDSNSSEAPPPPRVTADELLDAWSAHVCDMATRCCAFDVVDNCVETVRVNDAFRCIERGLDQGRITISQTHAHNCIRTLKENPNYCGKAVDSLLVHTEACVFSLRGKGRSGDACDPTCGTNAFGSECDFGFFCTSTGRCERLPNQDDPSCGTDYTCPLNYYCDKGVNRCVERRGPGASCAADDQCDFEHSCGNGRCVAICR